MTLLAHDRHCDEIALQIDQLRAVVTSGADLSATVPTCPDWSLERLVRHTGGALRWVDALVRARAQEEIPRQDVPLIGGPVAEGDPAALDAWLAETGQLVVGALREAGPDTKVWSWAGTPRIRVTSIGIDPAQVSRATRDALLDAAAQIEADTDGVRRHEIIADLHYRLAAIHPFANGNGRIARLLVAFICMRYTVAMFLHIKPRPEGEDYVRASRDSMGRPPDFVGNHTTTTAVFAHLLADELAGERVA